MDFCGEFVCYNILQCFLLYNIFLQFSRFWIHTVKGLKKWLGVLWSWFIRTQIELSVIQQVYDYR